MVKVTLKERSEHFLKRAKDKFGDKFIYDKVDYVDSTTLVKIFCTVHKDYFTRSPKDLLAAKTSTCPQCKFNYDRSTWEQRGLCDNVSYQGSSGYPSFTEYFDGYSWKSIDTYQKGTPITVFNPKTLKVSLEVPSKFIKSKNVKIVSFKTKYSRNTYKPFCIQVSINNKLLLLRHNSYFTSYILTKITRNQKVYIPTTFKTQEILKNVDDNFFRLLVHLYLTESRIFRLSNNKINIVINKIREFEKERLEYLLDTNNIEYNIKELKPLHKYSTRYIFNISMKKIKSIDIPVDWFNLSTYYKNIIIDELFTYTYILKRTSNINLISSNYYKCPNKKIFDFLQYTFHSLGIVSNFFQQEDTTGINHYYITKSLTSNRTLTDTCIEDFDYDDLIYSFKTKTGYCLFRQNNNIFIAPDGTYEIK